MSDFNLGAVTGFIVAIAIAVSAIFGTFRCRFGVHAWSQWVMASDGCSQYRTCAKCRLYQPRFIIDSKTGNTVKVTFPKVDDCVQDHRRREVDAKV